MKKIILLFFIFFPLVFLGQSYTDWEEHDIVRFYKKINLDYNSLDGDGEEIDEIYVPTKVEDGAYEIEVKKVSSKLYGVYGTEIYIYFRYSPYLYNYDEGVLIVSYNTGSFYEKP